MYIYHVYHNLKCNHTYYYRLFQLSTSALNESKNLLAFQGAVGTGTRCSGDCHGCDLKIATFDLTQKVIWLQSLLTYKNLLQNFCCKSNFGQLVHHEGKRFELYAVTVVVVGSSNGHTALKSEQPQLKHIGGVGSWGKFVQLCTVSMC